jgi:hypothetical protein
MAYCLQVLSEEGRNGRRRSSGGAGEGHAGEGVRASLENALMSAKQKNDKVSQGRGGERPRSHGLYKGGKGGYVD